MNIKNIREIAKIMKENDITLIEVKDSESSLHMERKPRENIYETVVSADMAKQNDIITQENKLPMTEKTVDFNHVIEIKSPMVGVFYSSPAPDKDPFVKIGSSVKKGDVLCVIEAMKSFNEILAEHEGEIVDICVENGQVVEFSQVLFKIY